MRVSPVSDLRDRIVDPDMQSYEVEASQFATDRLIPTSALTSFVRIGSFTIESICEFANEVGIGERILIGRLQQDGYISTDQGNALKQGLN